MIENRTLNINDCEQLLELMKSRPYTFNGYTDDQLKDTINNDMEKIIPNYFNDPLYYVPGIFVDGKLFGALICKEFSSSPSWSWGYWISDGHHDKMYTVEGAKAFRQWDQMLFDEMEINRKLNRFFIVYENRQDNTLKSSGFGQRLFTWMGRQGYRVSKYQFITDCELLPGEKPKYEYQQKLLTDRTWPIPISIRMGTLVK